MKAKIGIFSVILIPLLGLLFPELVDLEQGQFYANIFGVAGLITIVTEGVKKLLRYGELYGNKITWRYFPQVASLVIGIVLSFVGVWFELGMFADVDLIWWQVAGTGVIASGLSMAWYDTKFAQIGIQFIWGLRKSEKENE